MEKEKFLMCKANVVGAVNTWIRIINQEGEALIENEWKSGCNSNEDFVIFLTVCGQEKQLFLPKNDWFVLGANLLGHPLFQQLHSDLISAKNTNRKRSE